jgi:hypothetical protein
MPAVNCLRGPYPSMWYTVIFIDPNERPDFDRLYKRAGPICYGYTTHRHMLHSCVRNLILLTTIGEPYGLESYRRISDADNFGDIDHVSVLKMNWWMCGQDLTRRIVAPFHGSRSWSHFIQMILSYRPAWTQSGVVYTWWFWKSIPTSQNHSSMINTRKRNMDALYNIYGDKIDQWLNRCKRWMGLLPFCQRQSVKVRELRNGSTGNGQRLVRILYIVEGNHNKHPQANHGVDIRLVENMMSTY